MAQRLDEAVAARTGVSRSQARSLIMEGRVRVNGARAVKAGQSVRPDASIEVESPRRYVSRGGEKLAAALDAFGVSPLGLRALDIGASTGGFTDCLLQRGASHVTALDVGYGQLAWSLRNDERVTVIERSNFRNVPPDAFPGGFDAIVIDTSFISLRTILSRAVSMLRDGGWIVALIKPQFEAGRERLGSGGVVRDPAVHRAVLAEVRDAACAVDLAMVRLTASPLLGPAGNREFLGEFRQGGTPVDDGRIAAVVGEPREA